MRRLFRLPPPQSRTPRSRPRLEALEPRDLPATLTVLTLAESDLRATVARANDGDTIVFADGLIGTISLTQGELLLRRNLTIDGPGVDAIAIDGSHLSRIFEVAAGATVTLRGITIQDGSATNTRTSGTSASGEGGGVLVNFGATLTIDGCDLIDNSATGIGTGSGSGTGSGGAIYNAGRLTISGSFLGGNTASGIGRGSFDGAVANGGAVASSGPLMIAASILSGNQALANGNGGPNDTASAEGGAVWGSGPMTITGSVLSGNTADGAGSGIGAGYGEGGGLFSYGVLSLTGSTVRGNRAMGVGGIGTGTTLGFGEGGGVWRFSTLLTVADSTIADNTAYGTGDIGTGSGGGLYSFTDSGPMTIADSTLSGNTADGAGILSGLGSGGGIFGYDTTTIAGSTFSGNTASGVATGTSPGAGVGTGEGGGLWMFTTGDVTLTLTNCTFSGNLAYGLGSATAYGNGDGGGLYNEFAALTVTNCTFNGNGVQGMGTGTRFGGGLETSGGMSGQPQILINTIVAGNTRDSGPASDVYVVSGSLEATSRNNLIGTGGSGGLVDGVNGNLVGVSNPGLGTLGDYGGPTPTIPLLAGSPALHAGGPDAAPASDQRGVARTGGVDIGAYQASSAAYFLLTAPDTVPAGQPFGVVLTAYDAFGQVALGYTGTVYLVSSDPQAGYLGSYTFDGSEGGTVAFAGVVLLSPGPQSLYAVDTDANLFGQADLNVM